MQFSNEQAVINESIVLPKSRRGTVRGSPVRLFIFILLACTTAFVPGACEAHDFLHPDFSITKKDLSDTIRDLPAAVCTRILAEPVSFLELVKQALSDPQEYFAVVDKEHALLRSNEPPDLVPLDGKGLALAKNGLRLRKTALDALVAMSRAAADDDIVLVAGSAYRSFADQEKVYARWVKVLGQEQADRESARPGHSQHQLGTTVDFSPIDERFEGTDADFWLSRHAWTFGFSLSYPKDDERLTGYIYEPWHYRYVGKAGATIVEKYFLGSQSRFLSFFENRLRFFRENLRRTPGR